MEETKKSVAVIVSIDNSTLKALEVPTGTTFQELPRYLENDINFNTSYIKVDESEVIRKGQSAALVDCLDADVTDCSVVFLVVGAKDAKADAENKDEAEKAAESEPAGDTASVESNVDDAEADTHTEGEESEEGSEASEEDAENPAEATKGGWHAVNSKKKGVIVVAVFNYVDQTCKKLEFDSGSGLTVSGMKKYLLRINEWEDAEIQWNGNFCGIGDGDNEKVSNGDKFYIHEYTIKKTSDGHAPISGMFDAEEVAFAKDVEEASHEEDDLVEAIKESDIQADEEEDEFEDDFEEEPEDASCEDEGAEEAPKSVAEGAPGLESKTHSTFFRLNDQPIQIKLNLNGGMTQTCISLTPGQTLRDIVNNPKVASDLGLARAAMGSCDVTLKRTNGSSCTAQKVRPGEFSEIVISQGDVIFFQQRTSGTEG